MRRGAAARVVAGAIERYQIAQAQPEELAALLDELDELSDEEIQLLLADEEALVSSGGL